MTREEAERRRDELQAQQPEFHFVARERGDGAWEVAKVQIPEQLRQGPLKEIIE